MAIGTTTTTDTDRLVIRQEVLGSRRLSNYWWAAVSTLGGAGFLLASISSYLHINLLPFADPTELIFIPQGLAMGFYGVAGLTLGLYLVLTLAWNLGAGYNEFNRQTGQVTIFRWGYPGKNRRIELVYPLSTVRAVRMDLRDGLSPRRALYLSVQGKRDLLLTRIGRPIPLKELENQGSELAGFLGVPLEGM